MDRGSILTALKICPRNISKSGAITLLAPREATCGFRSTTCRKRLFIAYGQGLRPASSIVKTSFFHLTADTRAADPAEAAAVDGNGSFQRLQYIAESITPSYGC